MISHNLSPIFKNGIDIKLRWLYLGKGRLIL